MKTLFKILGVIAIIIGLVKLIEIGSDVLCQNCGRRYIPAQTDE